MFYPCSKLVVHRWILAASIFLCHCLYVAADDSSVEAIGLLPLNESLKVRAFSPYLAGKWIGQGIAYGPFRAGQKPGGPSPSKEQLTEDLNLLSQHWNLIRMYGTGPSTEQVMKIIHAKKLPIRVMLGAWISRESQSETLDAKASRAAKLANRMQVMAVIRLANAFPDEVIAVNVGNETQVFWSDHQTRPEVLIQNIRAVRAATMVPVTTADDFNFWNKPESKNISREIDFIALHVHPMWAGLSAAEAMPWTERIYQEIRKMHPDKTIVISEAGWSTQVHNEGEQARLIKGKAGEQQQRLYYQQFTDWAHKEKICTFFFEAFDEPWKGGPHPNEVEKHWGVFDLNRKPKAALTGAVHP